MDNSADVAIVEQRGHSGDAWRERVFGRLDDNLDPDSGWCTGLLSAAPETHSLMAVVVTLHLLQGFAPDFFRDDVHWSDIFSDRRVYRTDLVEG